MIGSTIYAANQGLATSPLEGALDAFTKSMENSPFNKNKAKPRETMQRRSFDAIARRMGYKKTSDGSYSHAKRKRNLTFDGSSDLGAHYMDKDINNYIDPNNKIKYDRVAGMYGKRYKDKGIFAHELGHALQGKPWLAANMGGKLLAQGSIAGIMGANLINPDFDTSPIAAVGTAGGLATLASEAHASYLGSKGFRSLKGKLSAFRGVPTYAAFAATPYAAHKASEFIRNKMKED